MKIAFSLLLLVCGAALAASPGAGVVVDRVVDAGPQAVPGDAGVAVLDVPVHLGRLLARRQTLGLWLPGVVEDFYKLHRGQPAWLQDGAWSAAGSAALQALRNADREGLVPARYHLVELDTLWAAVVDAPSLPARARALAMVDILLTDASLHYLLDLNAGASSPHTPGLKRFEQHVGVPLDAFLHLALDGGAVAQAWAAAVPAHASYATLRAALDTCRTQSRPDAVRSLVASMERIRWLPANLGQRHVMVNLANFQLVMVENGQEAGRMRVIGGKRGNRTPLLSSAITAVVLNPSWDVPASIVGHEILSAMQKDPSWAAQRGFLIRQHTDGGLVEVDPHSVDWASVVPPGPYHFRQTPGPGNALGSHKFIFDNPYQVYLHGSSSPELFAAPRRDFSHGCVRVESPGWLAGFLLPHASGSSLEDLMKSGREHRVDVQPPVPVHITYLTASVGPGGSVDYLEDRESRDGELLKRMGVEPPGEAPSLSVVDGTLPDGEMLGQCGG